MKFAINFGNHENVLINQLLIPVHNKNCLTKLALHFSSTIDRVEPSFWHCSKRDLGREIMSFLDGADVGFASGPFMKPHKWCGDGSTQCSAKTTVKVVTKCQSGCSGVPCLFFILPHNSLRKVVPKGPVPPRRKLVKRD